MAPGHRPSPADPSDSSRAHPPPALTPAELRQRLRELITAGTDLAQLTLVGIDRDTTDVLRRGLDHPEDLILGFVLPSRYSALAVVASSIVATPPHRNHQDAALGLAVSRTGDSVSLLSTCTGTMNTSDPQGWLIDACLRAVGRPTPSCDIAPLALPLALWLDRLLVALLHDDHPPLSWNDAVALCPAPTRWKSSNPIDLGTTLGSTTQSWRALRQATAHGAASPVMVAAEHAEWMDDAMFARWCLGSFPDTTSLRCDVEFLASPQVAENIEIALRAAWLAWAG